MLLRSLVYVHAHRPAWVYLVTVDGCFEERADERLLVLRRGEGKVVLWVGVTTTPVESRKRNAKGAGGGIQVPFSPLLRDPRLRVVYETLVRCRNESPHGYAEERRLKGVYRPVLRNEHLRLGFRWVVEGFHEQGVLPGLT